MRWEALFADLQAQWESQAVGDLEAEAAEAAALERSALTLQDRFRAVLGSTTDLVLNSGERLHLQLAAVGSDWLAGRAGVYSCLVPAAAVAVVTGLSPHGQAEHSAVRRRLGIAAPLRALVEGRESVMAFGLYGPLAHGRLLAAGADHLDIAPEHRGADVRTLPMSGVQLLRTPGAAGEAFI